MNKATRNALQKSIKHWEENLAKAEAETLTKNDIGSHNCALCARFNTTEVCKRTTPKGKVERCPVAVATGQANCDGSPWEDIRTTVFYGFKQNIINHTKRELEFLESLLPEGD